jgi:sec-independent protein translocase protein TatA
MLLASIGNFFGLDTLIIILVITLLFGGKKIPELARSLGASIREFKKGKDQENLDNKPS